MKLLYDKLSYQTSKMTTRMYSTSFSIGIYFLDKRLRNAIYSIYGFVRIADEIVDSFNDYNRKYLLEKFKSETREAIQNRISVNPILNSFQHIVHQYNINSDLIETFLRSMEMDLQKMDYTTDKYQQYIFGSAEVVGLMCLQVFVEGDMSILEGLKIYAMKLGAAFQKVNFLRDMKDDYRILGRIYFPNINMNEFTDDVKKQIELEIEDDFRMALTGIKKLPASSKGGVYLAYLNYRSLFKKIKKSSARKILNERIRINSGKKLRLMFNSLLQNKLNWI